MKRARLSLTLLLSALSPLLLLAACNPPPTPPPEPAQPAAPVLPAAPAASVDPAQSTTEPAAAASESLQAAERAAQAMLQPTEGNSASGELRLLADAEGVRISGTLQGLAPDSVHGFHVHEKGDCSAPDGSSAGGHFAPHESAHGEPGSKQHHAGDMPNQVADASGRIDVNVVLPGVELGGGGITDIANRALILHATADDYTSQPAGASGPRIACGVITLME